MGRRCGRRRCRAGPFRLVKDLSDDPVPWVEEIIDQHGVPSVLVNNVGVMDGRSFLNCP